MRCLRTQLPGHSRAGLRGLRRVQRLDQWDYPARFHVLFNDDGVVTNTLQIREDYGDSGSH